MPETCLCGNDMIVTGIRLHNDWEHRYHDGVPSGASVRMQKLQQELTCQQCGTSDWCDVPTTNEPKQ